MQDTNDAVVTLSEERCWNLLARRELGRLALDADGEPDIFPVNYVVDGRSLLFRTAQGSKLFELTVNDEVIFEVDAHTDTDAWSVVVRGRAHRLDTSDEVRAADTLPLTPWVPTLKYNYVRITPSALTGRAFRIGPEPERYGIAEY
jgi:nitroimidazol reductase NimA-like FMN-containing flavoprotein (pyridoxamine 5'-phosphate oxidase superfamily)